MNPRDEAEQLLSRDDLVTGKEYRRIIKCLINDDASAYEAGFRAGQQAIINEVGEERCNVSFGVIK